MSTYPIIYNNKSLWTSSQLIGLIRLLLIEQADKSQFDKTLLPLLLDNIDKSFELNIDRLIKDDDKGLLTLLKEIYGRLSLNSYYEDNEFAHNVWRIIASKYDKKKASKIVSDIPVNKKTLVIDLVSQIIRLVQGVNIFDVDTNASIKNFEGEWISSYIEFEPQFDINFNMTDLTPVRDEIKLKVYRKEEELYCRFIIQAHDYRLQKSGELDLVDGIMQLTNGIIRIKRPDKEMDIPIIKLDDSEFLTYIFKTKIRFKKITTR